MTFFKEVEILRFASFKLLVFLGIGRALQKVKNICFKTIKLALQLFDFQG